MLAGFSFEVTKLVKRPSTWILALVLVAAVAFLDYYQLYTAYDSIKSGGSSDLGGAPAAGTREFRDFLLPAKLPVNVPGFLATFGAPVVLILGVLSTGSEYGWGTVKTALTQGVGRLRFLASKTLAVALAILAFAVLSFASGLAASFAVAGTLGVDAGWPEASLLLKGLGVTWLVFGAWASLGMFLAFLFRGTALAIGLGLVYGFIVETLITSFADRSELFRRILGALLSKNSADLVSSLGSAPDIFSNPNPGDPTQAALILSAYVVACLLLSALLFKRRDVT